MSDAQARIEYARTDLSTLLAEGAEDLFAANFEEVEPYHERQALAPNYDAFRDNEKLNQLFLLAAHVGAELVGYDVLFLIPHIRYRTTKYAFGEILYLKPEHRSGWNGVRMLREGHRLLRAEGVRRVQRGEQLHLRIGSRGGTVGDLFRALGYEHRENVWTKFLEG